VWLKLQRIICTSSLLQQLVHSGVLIPGYTLESFDWNNYQKLTKFIAAPKSLFSNTQVAVSRITRLKKFRYKFLMMYHEQDQLVLICISVILYYIVLFFHACLLHDFNKLWVWVYLSAASNCSDHKYITNSIDLRHIVTTTMLMMRMICYFKFKNHN